MTERDVSRLLTNEGIVRHCGKIESTINNAAKAIELIASEGSLANYFWNFEPKNKATPLCKEDILFMTAESKALSKDLKKRGWSFVGPTTCYAFMQAIGLVNDHVGGCDFRDLECKTYFNVRRYAMRSRTSSGESTSFIAGIKEVSCSLTATISSVRTSTSSPFVLATIVFLSPAF